MLCFFLSILVSLPAFSAPRAYYRYSTGFFTSRENVVIDGHEFAISPFGTESLKKAIGADEKALEYFSQYRSNAIWGIVFGLAGAVAVGVSAGIDDNDQQSGFLIGGLLSMTVGGIFAWHGKVAFNNMVNQINGVEEVGASSWLSPKSTNPAFKVSLLRVDF